MKTSTTWIHINTNKSCQFSWLSKSWSHSYLDKGQRSHPKTLFRLFFTPKKKLHLWGKRERRGRRRKGREPERVSLSLNEWKNAMLVMQKAWKKYKIKYFLLKIVRFIVFFFPGYRVSFLASESGSLQKYINQS